MRAPATRPYAWTRARDNARADLISLLRYEKRVAPAETTRGRLVRETGCQPGHQTDPAGASPGGTHAESAVLAQAEYAGRG